MLHTKSQSSLAFSTLCDLASRLALSHGMSNWKASGVCSGFDFAATIICPLPLFNLVPSAGSVPMSEGYLDTSLWWCTDEKGAWDVLLSFYRAMGGIGHTCWQVCPLASSRCVQGSGAAVVGFTGQVSPEDFFITIEVQPLNPRFRGWTLNKVAYVLLQWTRSMLGTNDETTPPQKTKLFAYVNSWKSKTNQPKKNIQHLFSLC